VVNQGYLQFYHGPSFFQVNCVSTVDKAIQDCVCDGGIGDIVIPIFYGQL